MCCPLSGIHRHQIHLISYGSVSFCLISIGLLFSVFAIFQKDSIIGKVWLAGPTTIVVGLVLLGKVVIDWGPAMNSKHFNSMDFYAVNSTQNYNRMPNSIAYDNYLPKVNYGINAYETTIQPNGAFFSNKYDANPTICGANDCFERNMLNFKTPSNDKESSWYEMNAPGRNFLNSTQRKNLMNANICKINAQLSVCSCTDLWTPLLNSVSDSGSRSSSAQLYGTLPELQNSISSTQNIYQGETFVLIDRNYLI